MPLVKIGALIRILLGLNLLSFYLYLLPRFSQFFGPAVNPDLFQCFDGSPLFALWDHPAVLKSLWVGVIVLAAAVCAGFYARLLHPFLYALHLAFQHANPFIAHGEPDQLTNLMLLLMFFFPVEQAWSLKRSPWRERFQDQSLRVVFKIMLIYIAAYYFFAGLKKLPDPLWRSGQALEALLNWPLLGRSNPLTEFLKTRPPLLAAGSFIALGYELGMIFFVFSPLKKHLVPAGVVFHTLINLMLDVGHFHLAVWMWYPLFLLDRNT